jgi:hypothetical protein
MRSFNFFVVIALIPFLTCMNQINNTDGVTIRGFVRNLKDSDVPIAKVVEVYFKGKRETDFVGKHLEFARAELHKRNVEVDDIKISDISQVDDFKNIEVREGHRAYIVMFQGEILMPILMKGNEIISFSTLDKGGKKYFIKY